MIYDEYLKDKEIRDIASRRSIERMLLLSILIHALMVYSIIPAGQGPPLTVEEEPREQMDVHIFIPEPIKKPPREVIKSRPLNHSLKPIPAPEPDTPEIDREFLEYAPMLDEVEFIAEDIGAVSFAPPQRDAGPMRLSSEVNKPQLIHRVEPIYPALARKVRLEGMAVIEAVIDRRGLVSSAVIIKSAGHRLLDESALEAVRRWEFTPALLNGAPVDVYMNLTVVFRLD